MKEGRKKREAKVKAKKVSSVVIAAIILFSVFAVSFTATMASQERVNEFYGTLKIYGDDASTGTIVKGYIDGEERGSISVATGGQYHHTDLTYLQITGTDADEGKTIIFKVNGSQTHGREVQANETYTYDYPSGDPPPTPPLARLNLTVIAPVIYSCNPPEKEVSNNEGDTRTFTITVNQVVDVSWRINGTEVQSNGSVPADTVCSYTNTSAKEGTWNVSAIASNPNGTAMQTWDWTVISAYPVPTITDWYNNKTKNNSITITINESECVYFNATADQVIDTWSWFVNGVDQSHNFDSFTYCGWSVNGTYYVKVTATNATNGTSSQINWTVTVEDITPPAQVDRLTNGTPSAIAVDLWWDANTEADLVGYKVYKNGSLLGTTANTYYNVTGLSASTTYEFNVSAYDDNDLEGENATVIVRTPAPLAPTITGWNNITGSSPSVTVNETEAILFNATADQVITTWNWFRDGVNQNWNYDNFTTSWNTNGTYNVKVNATNTNGTSNTVTWTVTVNDITPPAKVQNLTNGTWLATMVDLCWNPNTEADLVGYKVYKNGSLLGTTVNTYYNVTGLNASTTYEFNVSAYDDNDLEGENATRIVTTAPELVTYNLTILSTAGGNVTEPEEGTFTYNESEVVNLKAVADASYRFVNWTGEVGTIANVSASETNITMNDNYTITANFTPIIPPYLVTYNITNRTITPPQITEIDVEFSERVKAWISIEDVNRNLVKQLYYNSGVTNPSPKPWNGTYTNGTVVPDGDYYVNVTGLNTTTGLSVINNTESINVLVPEPDLNVSSISINPGGTRGEDIVRAYVNESNNISAVVYNNGTADAGAFDVCFDADDVKIGCVEMASLAAGANTTVSIDWTPTCADYAVMPGFPAQSLPVTINVTADCNCADCPTCPADGSNGRVAESDETNNMLSKFISAIQQYAGYDVIGGVVNNGYKSKNFDCNTTEEPLTLFEYDTEIVGGGIVYNVSGEKISSFAPGDTSTRIHHIELPDGATVKKARLYVYWYDKWGNYKTYPTGCLANLRVNFSGTEFMPEEKYNDQKGFGYYQSPKGTYAYDVTSKVADSGDYTAIVENIDPANGTTLLGEMLYVAYEGASDNKIQIWTLEGNDYLMAADATHNKYNYGVSPEEATATVAFPGSIDVANVSSATLITVVAQGMASGSDMLFNGEVVKTDAWDAPTEAYSGSKINVESVDVTAKLSAGGNNMGFLDNGTNGMQASNAILVVEYPPEVFNRTINLTMYYNMISLPLNDTSVTNASTLIAKIGANCTEVSKWDKATQAWKSFAPGMPPIFDFDIGGGEGCFVRMSNATTVIFTGKGWESHFTISLVTGYNMIGIPVNDTSVTNASTLIAKIGACCTEVSKWDKDTQTWKSFAPGMPPIFDFGIDGGEGCFAKMVCPATVTLVGEAWSD